MSQISYQIQKFNQPLQRNVYPLPEPQEDEVLVKVTYCGVCHSDVHFMEGHFDMGDGQKMDLKRMELPMTPGHEIVGIIEQVGSAVKTVQKGERVAVYPLFGCQNCSTCANGEQHYCTFARFYGNTMQGGFSTHVVAHHRQVFSYGKADPAFAATCCCSGITTYSAIKKLGNLNKSSKVLFIGAGGLGMMAIQLFRKLYPDHPGPVVADIDQAKLEAAAKVGASEILNIKNDQKKINQLSKGSWFGEGFDGVVDFVGAAATVSQGIQMLNKGASIIVVGLFGGASKISIPIFPLKGISVRGNYLGTLEEFRELMEIVREGGITHLPLTIRPLSEAQSALTDLQKGTVTGRTVLRIDPQSSM